MGPGQQRRHAHPSCREQKDPHLPPRAFGKLWRSPPAIAPVSRAPRHKPPARPPSPRVIVADPALNLRGATSQPLGSSGGQERKSGESHSTRHLSHNHRVGCSRGEPRAAQPIDSLDVLCTGDGFSPSRYGLGHHGVATTCPILTLTVGAQLVGDNQPDARASRSASPFNSPRTWSSLRSLTSIETAPSRGSASWLRISACRYCGTCP
jgi:hypothetical protein